MRIRSRGFTFVEVIVIAVIVAILAILAIPTYNAYVQSARKDTAENLAATIAVSASSFLHRTGVDPTLEQLEIRFDTAQNEVEIEDSLVRVTVIEHPEIEATARFR